MWKSDSKWVKEILRCGVGSLALPVRESPAPTVTSTISPLIMSATSMGSASRRGIEFTRGKVRNNSDEMLQMTELNGRKKKQLPGLSTNRSRPPKGQLLSSVSVIP